MKMHVGQFFVGAVCVLCDYYCFNMSPFWVTTMTILDPEGGGQTINNTQTYCWVEWHTQLATHGMHLCMRIWLGN